MLSLTVNKDRVRGQRNNQNRKLQHYKGMEGIAATAGYRYGIMISI